MMKKKMLSFILCGILCVSMVIPVSADTAMNDAELSEEIIIDGEAAEGSVLAEEQTMIEEDTDPSVSIQLSEEEQPVELEEEETTEDESVYLAEDNSQVAFTHESEVKDGRTFYCDELLGNRVLLEEEITETFIQVPNDGNYIGRIDATAVETGRIIITDMTNGLPVVDFAYDYGPCDTYYRGYLVLQKGRSYSVTLSTEVKSYFHMKVTYERFKGNITLKNILTGKPYDGKAISDKRLFKHFNLCNGYISDMVFSTKSDFSDATATYPTQMGKYYVRFIINSYDDKMSYTVKDQVEITKQKAVITVTTKSKTFSYTDLQKSYKSFSLGAASTSGGALTFRNAGSTRWLKVKDNGRVYVLKGAPKGKYHIYLEIWSAGTTTFTKGFLNVDVEVYVK